MKFHIFYQTELPRYLRRTRIFEAACARALHQFRRETAEVNIVFVDEKEILRINKAYLNHHYVTDVISFNHQKPPFDLDGEPWTFGEVYVCYQVARKNAPLFEHTILQEMMMYAVHGCLHLSGMDDHAPQDRAEMDQKAEKIIAETLPKKTASKNHKSHKAIK